MNKEARNFQGMLDPQKEHWLGMVVDDWMVEFSLSNNETGVIYEDGTVFYNEKGLNLFKFANREDAYVFLFGADDRCPDRDYEYEISTYIGSRDEDPALVEKCMLNGIAINDEEDGSSVFSDWKIQAHSPSTTTKAVNEETPVSKLIKWEENLFLKSPDGGNSGLKFEPTKVVGAVCAKDKDTGLEFWITKSPVSKEWLIDVSSGQLSFYDGKASSQERAIHQASVFLQSLKEHQFIKEIGLEGHGSTQNAYNTLRYGTSDNIDAVQQRLGEFGYTTSETGFPHVSGYILDRVSNDQHPDYGKPYVGWEMQSTPEVFKTSIENIEKFLLENIVDTALDSMSKEERVAEINKIADGAKPVQDYELS